MAKVKLLTSLGNHAFSKVPGDMHECDDAEAARLIERDQAVPWVEETTEKTVRRGPAETR